MTKPVEIQMAITRVSATAASGVSMGLKSPKDLSTEDISHLMQLVSTVAQVIIIPEIARDAPLYKIDKELSQKTPGQRLRNVFYVLWEQSGSQGDFNRFYDKAMERIIEGVKDKLD